MYESKTKDCALLWTFQHKSWHLCLLLWCLLHFTTITLYYCNCFSTCFNHSHQQVNVIIIFKKTALTYCNDNSFVEKFSKFRWQVDHFQAFPSQKHTSLHLTLKKDDRKLNNLRLILKLNTLHIEKASDQSPAPVHSSITPPMGNSFFLQ